MPIKMMRRLLPPPTRMFLHRIERKARDLVERWHERSFRPYIADKSAGGCRFRFVIADPTGRLWYDSGKGHDRVDHPEWKLLRERLIRPGDVVFDCGGHHGWTAILLAHYVGETGRVVTFEPHPRNIAIIARNVALNGLTNVSVVQAALGPADQPIVVADRSDTLVKPEHYDADYWPEDACRPSVLRGIGVPMITLDSYARRHDLWPTVLKIDVEGYEIELLKGAQDVLARMPIVSLELHHRDALARYNTQASDLLQFLDFQRYHLSELSRDSSLKPVAPVSLRHHCNWTHLVALPVAAGVHRGAKEHVTAGRGH